MPAMGERLALLFCFLGLNLAYVSVFLTLFRAGARKVHLAVARYVVGFGPPLLKLRLADGVAVEVRAVPWTGYAVPLSRAFDAAIPPEMAAGLATAELRYLEDLPVALRAAFALLSLAVTLCIACALLGPVDAITTSGAAARAFFLEWGSRGAFDGALDAFREQGARRVMGGIAAVLAGLEWIHAPGAIAYAVNPVSRNIGKARALVTLSFWAIGAVWVFGYFRWLVVSA